jgi:hypothetical protein
MIEDTSWNWRVDLTDNMVDAMLRSYAVSIWQALLAAQPWHTWSDLGYGPPKDYPDKYVLKTSSNLKNWYWLSHDPDIDDSVPEGVLKDLFDPHQAGNIFPLGVPLADVFEGQNGWPRLQYGCPYFSGCEPPPGNTSLPSEFTSEPTLYPQIGVSRDENTKEILVEVTLYNQGLTPARNLEITDASLNGRKAAPTGLQTSVHQGDPQTILLRFPDIRKTTSANLKISGSYLGGKFDTTIRVEVP